MTDIEQSILKHVRDLAGDRLNIGDGAILAADLDTLGLDSLESLELIMKLEDDFDIDLDEDKVTACASVPELVAIVQDSRNAG